MNDKFLHNVFGEKIDGQPSLKDKSFGKMTEEGDIVPDYQGSEYTDQDGFDIRYNENGEYKVRMSLAKGSILCRYGTEMGRYTTYVGASYEQLALPWDIRTVQYHEYEVIADGFFVELVVTKGIVGPQSTFRSEGGAIQFLHDTTIHEEVESRHTLRRISYENECGRKNLRDFETDHERNN